HKHRWVPREGPGDENYWECRDCGAAFSGAPDTGEGKYRMPSPWSDPFATAEPAAPSLGALRRSGRHSVSSTIVTGPSFTISTLMRAPKEPVATSTPRS